MGEALSPCGSFEGILSYFMLFFSSGSQDAFKGRPHCSATCRGTVRALLVVRSQRSKRLHLRATLAGSLVRMQRRLFLAQSVHRVRYPASPSPPPRLPCPRLASRPAKRSESLARSQNHLAQRGAGL